MSSGARVSIPNSVRKTIQNIKEITGNHSEEDVYAMLKECSMDPNETTQRLLLQDTFHEVKRKRDRRKENLNNKESTDSRWRPGMQGRGNKAGQGSYSSRYLSNDAGGGRNFSAGKENGINQVTEKGVGLSSLPISQDTKKKEATAVTSGVITDGSSDVASGSSSVVNKSAEGSAVDISKLGGPSPLSPHVDAKEKPTIDFGTKDTHGQLTTSSSSSSALMTSIPSSGVYFSSSDPILVPSHDSRVSSNVGTVKQKVESQRTSNEQIVVTGADSKATAAVSGVGSSIQGNMPSKSQGIGNNQLLESAQLSSSSDGGPSVVKISSNYHGRSLQANGTQKVGPNKEWKPKLTNPNLAQVSGKAAPSEVPSDMEINAKVHPMLTDLDWKEATSEVQKKIEGSHISDFQHVIIPDHLHVPEANKIGFCFGSFDASFDLSTSSNNDSVSDKSPTPLPGTSEVIKDTVETHSSNQNDLKTGKEGELPHHPVSPKHAPELSSVESDVSSSTVPDYTESKQEDLGTPGNNQHVMTQTSSNFSFGFMPPILSAPLAPIESSETQARDISRLSSFIVPQPFDPTNYYAQFYRPGADSDGRISPFHPPGVMNKYNGNIAVLSPQTSQSPQEGENSSILSTAGPTPLVTQTAGLMPSSVAVTQQPLPIFRQPTALHIPHFPPNYFPYSPYLPPFYMPPPAIHQILGNGAFPQQPHAGNIYPAPLATSAKYSLPHYKPGNNTGNSTYVGVSGNYAPYGASPTGYSPSSASTAANSTANEDSTSSQFKENSVYNSGQQTEGSAAWMAPPGRDVSGLPASSFYNTPQGHFGPTQAGLGSVAGFYHPAQAVTPATVHPLLQQSQTMAGPIDAAGPPSSVYQQSQQAHINWPNNY